MKSGVVVFPGSNRERDMLRALENITGSKPAAIWHADTELPDLDLVVLCGGFSYGDYLRTGAIAAASLRISSVDRGSLKGPFTRKAATALLPSGSSIKPASA